MSRYAVSSGVELLENYIPKDFDALADSSKEWVQMTALCNGRSTLDLSARNSFVLKNRSFSIIFNDLEGDICGEVTFEDAAELKWSLLRYNPGGHFERHVDTRSDEVPGHRANILLFPPHQEFTGGELVVWTSSGEEQVLYAGPSTEWVLVILPLGVDHACKPVLSGARYVFKSRLGRKTGTFFKALSLSVPKEVCRLADDFHLKEDGLSDDEFGLFE